MKLEHAWHISNSPYRHEPMSSDRVSRQFIPR